MKTLNTIGASLCFVGLFVSGLGWLLDQFNFWNRNTWFQQWISEYAFPDHP